MKGKEIYHAGYRDLVAQLKDVRRKAGMTQADVARKMGVSRTWVAKIECCELRLDLLHFVRLCRVHGLQAGELISTMGEE
jgi:transcriptional regulator with XRE-family HTH domain